MIQEKYDIKSIYYYILILLNAFLALISFLHLTFIFNKILIKNQLKIRQKIYSLTFQCNKDKYII